MPATANQQVIEKTKDHVKHLLQADASGHDWWHTYRVWQCAMHIGEREKANLFVVQLAALLHDIADYKLHDGDDTLGPKVAAEWLQSMHVDTEVITHVGEIIRDMSFKGAYVESKMRTREGMIVQDADRLDALGAIGVARAFAYGGYKRRSMYDPAIPPHKHTSFDEYKSNTGPTINHFYEKLLLLKDLMNTDSAKAIAANRHAYMHNFLEQFLSEWDGNDI